MNIYFPFPCEYSDFSLAESFYSIFLHSKCSEISSECVLVWIFSRLFYLALSRLHLIKEFDSLAQKKKTFHYYFLCIYYKNIGLSPTISIVFLHISYTCHLLALSSEEFFSTLSSCSLIWNSVFLLLFRHFTAFLKFQQLYFNFWQFLLVYSKIALSHSSMSLSRLCENLWIAFNISISSQVTCCILVFAFYEIDFPPMSGGPSLTIYIHWWRTL